MLYCCVLVVVRFCWFVLVVVSNVVFAVCCLLRVVCSSLFVVC